MTFCDKLSVFSFLYLLCCVVIYYFFIIFAVQKIGEVKIINAGK